MSNTEATIKEINQKELDNLVQRVEEAIEHNLALSSEDLQLLLQAIQTLASLQGELADKNVTLRKLKKLLGMIPSSEKSRPKNGSKKRKQTKSAKKPRSRTNTKPIKVVNHTLQTLKKGSPCPDELCNGKTHAYKPFVLIRITAHAPYEAIKHVAEQVQCNLCRKIYRAELPGEVLEDGEANQQYGYTARSLMAVNKFFSGQGYNHQDNLSELMGHRISASTNYDQCEYLSNDVMPIFYQLRKEAAKANHFLGDDTTNRILDQQPEERPNRNGKGKRLRTGIYSSGIIAKTNNGEEIVLFETSLSHLGEFLDDILKNRPPTLAPPSIMTDALTSNKPTVRKVIAALCNAHSRRNFLDVEEQFPEEVEHVRETYGQIWTNNTHTQNKEMNDQERLKYHKEHSLPVMEALKAWCKEQQAAEGFEEHSGLGKAIKYFLKHYPGLTEFCRTAGVPIDNNRMEETLKIVIRGRKNYHFFKTVNGAGVANVLTSLIATGWRAGINVYEYLVHLQRYKDQVKNNPAAWVPYRYEETLAGLQKEKTKKAA